MQVDHGGFGPPTVNPKPHSASDTMVALSCAVDKYLKKEEKRQQEFDEEFKKFEKITSEYFATFGNLNQRVSLTPSNKQNNTLNSATDTHTKAQEDSKVSAPSRSPTNCLTKSTATSTNKSRLVVSSAKFPDPKNCAIFLQPTTREVKPCWFHKESGRVVSTTMTQHEALEQGPSWPHRFHLEASLPTTEFFARTLGATCSAKHYHAFRRPPPARDKNQARRVPRKQAMHTNDYFKMPRRATKFKITHFKLTRGATLRKEHYQAFRKPPPTRDRKQDWIKKHRE